MKSFMIHFLWSLALVSILSCLFYTVSEYNKEESKNNAFMMKACVDSGGTWATKGWTSFYECKRPVKE